MRTVSIAVHNNHTLELFVQKRKTAFELWQVGIVNGRRILLDHYLTHDDLEAKLSYAEPGDLVWEDTKRSHIPAEKHRNVLQREKMAKRDSFSDFDKIGQKLLYHFAGCINMFSIDRKAFNHAKKVILGHWTDGVVAAFFEPEHKIKLSYPMDRPHSLNASVRMVNWWAFGRWQLHLLDEHKTGIRIGVLRVDEHELHVYSQIHNRIAHIMYRARIKCGNQ